MTTTRLRCVVSSCYMPVEKGSGVVDRFEDEYQEGDGSDIYEVPKNLVKVYLDSGNFVEAV